MDRLLGKKLGMTQIFQKDGTVVPVTVIEIAPNIVIQKKTKGKEGYDAIQVGMTGKKEKNTTKPLKGHFNKAKTSPKRYLKEFPITEEELNNIEIGQELKIEEIFEPDNFVDVTAKSKGRGFTGVIKRHNFKGFKETHGTHEYKRHGGSIGMASYPARVLKGHKMAGQQGNKKVTVLNQKLVKIDKERSLLFIEGNIPGAPNNIVLIKKAVKKSS